MGLGFSQFRGSVVYLDFLRLGIRLGLSNLWVASVDLPRKGLGAWVATYMTRNTISPGAGISDLAACSALHAAV